ncbi:MAG: hypothetical protein QW743_02605 [Candidatus Methanomethylicia archaeon]
MVDIITEIGLWVAAFLTIACISIAYRDNPVFKFAEHTYVGAAIGYTFVAALRNIKTYGIDYLYPTLKDPWYIVPLIIGVTMYFRYHRTLYWIFRYGIAIVVGTSVTAAFVRSIEADFIAQIVATASLDFRTGTIFDIIGKVLLWVSLITALYYFIFTFPRLHTGSLAFIPRLGKTLMMLAFGYAFANTVLSRIDLFVGRLQFLLFEWLRIPT